MSVAAAETFKDYLLVHVVYAGAVVVYRYPPRISRVFDGDLYMPRLSAALLRVLVGVFHEVQQRAAQVAVNAPDRRLFRRGDFDTDLFLMRQSLYFVAHVGDQLLEVHSAERRQLGHCVRV